MLAGAGGFQGSPEDLLLSVCTSGSPCCSRGAMVDAALIVWSRLSGNWPLHPVELCEEGLGELRGWEAPSGCLSGNLPGCVCAKMEPLHPGRRQRGCPLQHSGVCAHRRQMRVVPGGPGGLGHGLSPGPLSRWLLPASFRGTVNPLNGLGGNSSSPPLNGSSDAACGALEVAELRPYSGPNRPPTPSQNNNNPSDILAAGGTQAAFVLSRSGDPLLVQQQCPFVRPVCWTGTVNGRFC